MALPRRERTGGRELEEEVQGEEAAGKNQPAKTKMRTMRMKLPGDAGERTRRSPPRNVAVGMMMTRARTRLQRGSRKEQPIRRKEAKLRTVMRRTAT